MEMEKMEQVELMLLDLPTDVIEEILLYLKLRDRKNIRLTCKLLYELCNSARICMKEEIIWRGIDMSIVNAQPGLLEIGRSCYNLAIRGFQRDINNPLMRSYKLNGVEEFFKVNGAKVHSLVIQAFFTKGLLESLIMSCTDLRSLTLSLGTPNHSPSSDYFTLEPNTITCPTVTFLKLALPEHQPAKYFHRMLSVFPNVKQLKIKLKQLRYTEYLEKTENMLRLELETAQECSAIFDDIIKCGSNLESLRLNIPLNRLRHKISQFCEALSNLKDLSINFNCDITLYPPEILYSCLSNLESLELRNPTRFQLIRVLENTQLNSLKIFSANDRFPIDLNKENFIALVFSKLKIVRLEANAIRGLPMKVIDFPLEANRTVTDLYLYIWSNYFESPVLLFSMYFSCLVHLSILCPTDKILQSIFQYQQNLRSLEIENCIDCSQEGFCGSKDGRFKYSINNLQKLEHLSIFGDFLNIIASDEFKNVFNLPRLEYLCIKHNMYRGDNDSRGYGNVRLDLYENLTNLQALRIINIAMPGQEAISSLFTKLKHLNYMRFDMESYMEETYAVVFINSEEFSLNMEDYKYKYPLGDSYYDKELDRMVILNELLKRKLCSPKISSYEINWIDA